MNVLVTLAIRLHGLLTRLYPSDFRNEFGVEMTDVFAEAIRETAKIGVVSLTTLCLRELRDWPGAVLCEHVRAKRQRHRCTPANEGSANRSSSRRVFVALLLFFFPIVLSLGLWLPAFLLRAINFFIFLWILTAFAAGLFRGLPRWFFPYAGLLSSAAVLYFVIVPLMDVGLLNRLQRLVMVQDPAGRLAWLALPDGVFWISILALVTLLLLLFAAWRPLRPIYWRIRRDWTLLSFFLYGAVPLILILSFDDYKRAEPYLMVVSLCLAAGAWAYTHATHTWGRALSLFAGVTLAVVVVVVGKWILVPNQVWFSWHAPGSQQWFEAWQTAVQGAWILIALAAPAFMNLLPSSADSLPAGTSRG